MGPYERLLRPLLFRARDRDPEQIHERTLKAIAAVGGNPVAHIALAAWYARHQAPRLVAGIRFPSLVGLAAGMDKNGLALHSWSALGFGHAEFGTVTAQAQPGNPRPRLFRLAESTALLNRMGFNNNGASTLAARLRSAGVRRGNRALGLVVGVSIGKTKATPLAEAAADYEASALALAPYADYLAVNVSSPNTPGLRSLQDAPALGEILTVIARVADDVPVFVKIAPDLTEPALEQLLDVCLAGQVAGLIATNTTLSRDGIADADRWRAGSAGGISGAPLTGRARAVVAFLRSRTDLPIIGVGGLLDADSGRAMLDAGADLLQLYTGLVYRGPGLVRELNALGGARG